jgi:hypothetical protein
MKGGVEFTEDNVMEKIAYYEKKYQKYALMLLKVLL